MKKSILLLVAGAVAFTAGAQQSQVNVVQHQNDKKINVSELRREEAQRHHKTAASKTTNGGDRWYFYGNYLDTVQNLASQGIGIYPEFLTIWNNVPDDTLGKVIFTDGVDYQKMGSMGTILNPSDSVAFNNYNYYGGLMKITSSNHYNVDSVELLANYGYNTSDTTIPDTIRLTFTYGPLTGTSDIQENGLSGSTHGALLLTFQRCCMIA